MSVNGRAKGATFERAIATDLRLWLGEDWTVKRLRTDEQQGTEDSGEFAVRGPFRFPFALECKTHKVFRVGQLWKQPITGPLPSWWAQTCRQAEQCQRLPLLVVRVPQEGVLAVLRRATALRMGLRRGAPSMELWVDDDMPGGDHLVVVPWAHVTALDPSALYLDEVRA